MELSAIFVSILVAAIVCLAVSANEGCCGCCGDSKPRHSRFNVKKRKAPAKRIRKAMFAGRGKMYYDDPYLLN